MLLTAEQITFVYGKNTPFERKALDCVDFSIEKGQMAGLIGHTGSGKSTLIQHLNGLLKPTDGKISFKGKNIWLNTNNLRNIRFQIGLVFQYPEYQLFEETVEADIAFGPKNMGLSAIEVTERVREAMEFVGLDHKLAKKSPFDLSGGQKRRVAIAGVIAMRPAVLVLDEPTAGLDPKGRHEILSHILQYRANTNAAIVLATHNMEDIARTADIITVLHSGKTAMRGNSREIFSESAHLEQMGLSVPGVTAVMNRLRAMGFELDDTLCTVDACAQELIRIKELSKNA